MNIYNNKVAVVTGAGSGIGRALAIELARRGAKLSLSDINGNGLKETAEIIGSESTFYQTVDVADLEQISKFAKGTMAHFGVIHQLYNNAGIASNFAYIMDTPYSEFEKVLNINLWGVIFGTREFLPHIIASGDGHIINISSLNGIMAQPKLGPYVTSKFAVRGFTETLRTEMLVRRLPVKVVVVHPGGVKTGIASSAASAANVANKEEGERIVKMYEEKLFIMTAEECAKIILDGVNRGKSRIRTGQTAMVDRLVRLFPQRYPSYIVSMMRRGKKK